MGRCGLLLFLVVAQAICKTSLAYDYCGYYHGAYWYCYDDGDEIGYCCGHNSYEMLCCYYTAVWELWYFWLGIGLACLFLSLCIAGLYRRRRRRRLQQFATATAPVQVSTVTTSAYPGMVNPNYNSSENYYPPPYQPTMPSGLPNAPYGAIENNQSKLHEESAPPYPGQGTAAPY